MVPWRRTPRTNNQWATDKVGKKLQHPGQVWLPVWLAASQLGGCCTNFRTFFNGYAGGFHQFEKVRTSGDLGKYFQEYLRKNSTNNFYLKLLKVSGSTPENTAKMYKVAVIVHINKIRRVLQKKFKVILSKGTTAMLCIQYFSQHHES